jgi:hypothetical protein
MLLLEHVLKLSKDDRFDTVYFFERRQEDVLRTQESIPGANGFTGDFLDVVLAQGTDGAVSNPLEFRRREKETGHFIREQNKLEQRERFMKCFPFDVVNLDLESFLFKPHDPLPGRVINAIGNILDWQKFPFLLPGTTADVRLDAFGLMFTTRIGPPNLTPDYKTMLIDCLSNNIGKDAALSETLAARAGVRDANALWRKDFETFFKVAMPKIIASKIHEHDWFVDPDDGWQHFEFGRDGPDGPYKMLHLIFNVRRQNPPRSRRPPFTQPPAARDAYKKLVTQIVATETTLLTDRSIDKAGLKAHLARIRAIRESVRTQS